MCLDAKCKSNADPDNSVREQGVRGAITPFERRFVIKQLIEANKAINYAINNPVSKYSGTITREMRNTIRQYPLGSL